MENDTTTRALLNAAAADKASEDAWLLYLDRCAIKHGARRPDYLFLLREFGARTATELGRNR